jgi:thiopeptide-type bacteriocin biosynthesis protein
MKDGSEPLRAAGFFAFRTPLLPFEAFAAWGADLAAPCASGGAVQSGVLQADREKLRSYLRKFIERAEVREAIYLASPSLGESLPLWVQAPDSERGRKVEKSLVKYFARMSGRSTPLGLFAGVSTGQLGKETVLRLVSRSEYRRCTRLDFHYLGALAWKLFHDPDFRLDVRVRPNTSLHRIGNSLRFQALQEQGEHRSFFFIVAETNPLIDHALTLAASTAITPRQLAAALATKEAEISQEEAAGLLAQLLDIQLLVSELDPPVTGPGALDDLIRQLERHPGADDLKQRFSMVRAALAEMDGLGLAGASTERYGAIAATLQGLPAAIERGKLYQVDLFKPTVEATLGEAVTAELCRGISALRRMYTSGDPLKEFRELFRQRYEENPEDVPLQDLLDSEIGLFARGNAGNSEGTLLQDVGPMEAEAPATVAFTKADEYRLRLLLRAVASGQEIILGEEDIERLSSATPPPLPDALSAQAVLGAPSAQALREGHFKLHFLGAYGPAGGNLLGRFCYGDEALAAGLRELLSAEEAVRPDAIFAEVVHLPSIERVGNFLQRPLLRGHEIPYLGRSAAPPECQIPVGDLTVSVIGERVVLRSRSLGKEVLPRLTNAHYFGASANDGLYRFLCNLQLQGVAAGLRWSWGSLKSAPYLPRVVYGKLVLSLATWNLTKDEMAPLAKAADAALYQAAQDLRARRKLPRFVLFSGDTLSDNWLPIDLDNLLSIEAWAQLLGALETGILHEMFPGPDELVAEGPEGRFTHELVVPFRLARAPSKGPAPARQASQGNAQAPRIFSEGSEWLYAKVYLSSTAVDDLLIELGPAFDRLSQAGAMDGFYFVRYGDPFWHLRVRVHGAPGRLRQEVLPALSAASKRLESSGLAWRFQLDTYRRELERYGGEAGMELCERIFCADSAAVLGIVRSLTGEEPADIRWQLALPGMDRLMEDLGLSLEERLLALEPVAAAFRREFRSTPDLERALGKKHRALGKDVEVLLRGTAEDAGPLAAFSRHFRARSQALKPLGEALRQTEARGALRRPLTEIVGSLLHMHVNRMLRAYHRPHEVVLYDLLLRQYRSRKALLSKKA